MRGALGARLNMMWPFRRFSALHSGAIDVLKPRYIERGPWSRVEADVDGYPVWFTTRDTRLTPAIEAFGSALLVPAMHAGKLLYLHAPACRTWTANSTRLTEAFRELWYPEAPGVHAVPSIDGQSPAARTALCFSGGVDSFHTLLTSGQAIDQLIYVLGYDVKLRERRRAATIQQLVRQVAAETGATAISIATNFRKHPLQKQTPWLRSFGGALAAIGHLLTRDVGQLLMSSDGLGCEDPEVGSRVSTDLFHSSDRLRIVHYAALATRLEKIRVIGSEPLVQRHLRVCWKNVANQLNCGRCEKCVRTMIELEACGLLDRFASFGRGRGLVAAIDDLPSLDPVVSFFFHEALNGGLSLRPAAAVRRLLERSQSSSDRRPTVRATDPVSTSRRTMRGRRLLPAEAFVDVCQPLVGKRVGYVRPLGNVGDELIELAMTQLFAEFGVRWSLCDLQRPTDFDLLVFGGGGNMGSRYVNNYDLRRKALAVGLPLIVLPQTFTTPEEGPFQRVFVRERESLRLHPAGILAPDLALGLTWPAPGRPRQDLGVFLRRDRERGDARRLFARDPVRLRRTVGPYLALAAAHRRIITDRLHFAIAGLHAGRDVTLVANDYHKNRSMHDTWLASLGCRFASSLGEAMIICGRAA